MRPMVIAATTLAIALAVAGCGSSPVPLLTGDGSNGPGACYLSSAEGELVVDAVAGTAITQITHGIGQDQVSVTPVMWPLGYTGRSSGGEVEVLDRSGTVVVRTGSRYHIGGGYEANAWLACTGINPPTKLP